MHLMMRRISHLAMYAALSLVTGCASVAAPGGVEQGVVQNGNVELRWFLDLPAGDEPFPAVVYGPGSGNVSAAHGSTIDFARELNGLGIAVMRYDKRGTGGSDGEVIAVSTANSEATIPVLASDMKAVLDQLLTDPRIDRQRIGLVGASQARWYMPVVAQETPEVTFIVVITGGVVPVGFQNRYEELTRIDGLSPDEAEAELGLLSNFNGRFGFNPIPILEVLDIPVLYLLGGDDRTGPLQANIVATIDLIANGVDLQVKTYDGAEHLLPGVDFWPDVASWLDDRGLR